MLEKITSANNPFIKEIRKLLSSSKARREANTYVAEGIHLVQSLISSQQKVTTYLCATSAMNNPEIRELQENLAHVRGIVVPDSLFESISTVHASVGIIAVFSLESPLVDSILPLKETTLLLEDIQDPGNMGTILRTAAAVGVRHVVLSSGCASPWSPKALRAGMGAQFSLGIYEDSSLLEAVTNAVIPVLATSLASDSTSLYDLDLTQPVAWIFGNEGAGISVPLAKVASRRVLIPQVSSSVESLNVAAAATVCLYEQYRQTISL